MTSHKFQYKINLTPHPSNEIFVSPLNIALNFSIEFRIFDIKKLDDSKQKTKQM